MRGVPAGASVNAVSDVGKCLRETTVRGAKNRQHVKRFGTDDADHDFRHACEKGARQQSHTALWKYCDLHYDERTAQDGANGSKSSLAQRGAKVGLSDDSRRRRCQVGITQLQPLGDEQRKSHRNPKAQSVRQRWRHRGALQQFLVEALTLALQEATARIQSESVRAERRLRKVHRPSMSGSQKGALQDLKLSA